MVSCWFLFGFLLVSFWSFWFLFVFVFLFFCFCVIHFLVSFWFLFVFVFLFFCFCVSCSCSFVVLVFFRGYTVGSVADIRGIAGEKIEGENSSGPTFAS